MIGMKMFATAAGALLAVVQQLGIGFVLSEAAALVDAQQVFHAVDFQDGSPGYFHITWSDHKDELKCDTKTITQYDVVHGDFFSIGTPPPPKGQDKDACPWCGDFDNAWLQLGNNSRFAPALTAESPRGWLEYKDNGIEIFVHCQLDADYKDYGDALYCCKGQSTWLKPTTLGQPPKYGFCQPAGKPAAIPYGG